MKKENLIFRKNRHLNFFKKELHDIGQNGLNNICLNYSSLDFIYPEDVSLQCTFMNATLGAPFFLASVTGGTPEGAAFNRKAAECAARLRLPMATGSLRALLENPDAFSTFDVNPHGELPLFFGNLGVASALRAGGRRIRQLCDALHMHGLFLYFNHAQEIAQPAAEHECVDPAAVPRFIEEFGAPVCIKETGMGFSLLDLQKIKNWPIAAIDTAGCGGSNFLQVEASQGDIPFAQEELEPLVCTLGHPTAHVVREALPLGIPVIAGGGIRTGLDIARALAMGASLASAAAPLVNAWHADPENGITDWVQSRIEQLRVILALCGTPTLEDFRKRHRALQK